MTSLFVLADAIRTRALLTPPKSQAKKHSQNLLPQKKKGRRSAKKTRVEKGPHHQAMRRAPLSPVLPLCGGPRPDPIKRARPHGAGALAFRRPTAALRRVSSRLGSSRASWNHRMQREDPLRHPCSEHLAVRTRAGRDDAQAARERSVFAAPHENRPRSASRSTLASGVLRERDFTNVTAMETNVQWQLSVFTGPAPDG